MKRDTVDQEAAPAGEDLRRRGRNRNVEVHTIVRRATLEDVRAGAHGAEAKYLLEQVEQEVARTFDRARFAYHADSSVIKPMDYAPALERAVLVGQRNGGEEVRMVGLCDACETWFPVKDPEYVTCPSGCEGEVVVCTRRNRSSSEGDKDLAAWRLAEYEIMRRYGFGDRR